MGVNQAYQTEARSTQEKHSGANLRVYLSGAMRGLPDNNFPAFHAAAAKLRAEGHIVCNPAELPYGEDDLRSCFAADMVFISLCAQAVAFLPGWENSLGAQAEHALAKALGLVRVYL